MAEELRAFVTAVVLAAMVAAAFFGFIFNFLGANGANVPVGTQTNATYYIHALNRTVGAQVNQTSGTTSSGLSNLANSGVSGILGNVLVFGGAVLGFLGFFFTVPQDILYLIGLYSLVPIVSQVATFFEGALVAIGAAIVGFEIVSSIMKYRL